MPHSQANSPLGQAMRQCGLDNFTIEIIEYCETQAEVNERERFWIKVLILPYLMDTIYPEAIKVLKGKI